MDIGALTTTTLIPLLQLTIAMALGGLIGVERSVAGKTAGMRTYSLVSLGAAFFVLTSHFLPSDINGDLIRIPSAIISGIGFLGAGLILFKENESTVSGLTTAAGLWIAAGVGIAVAYELYLFAVFTTLLSLFIFTLMWDMEQKIISVAEDQDIYDEEDKKQKEV